MVITTSRRALAGTALALGVIIAAAAGCSSSSPATSPAPGESLAASYARAVTAPALLAQCAFSYAARDPKASPGATELLASAQQDNASNPGQRWLYGSTLRLVSSNNTPFLHWFDAGPNISLGGQPYGNWVVWAANHDSLPSQVCGTSVPAASARHLYAQIFRNWPSMLKDNTWAASCAIRNSVISCPATAQSNGP